LRMRNNLLIKKLMESKKVRIPQSRLANVADGQLLASGSADNTIILWDIDNKKRIATMTSHNDGVNTVAFITDGQLLASGSDDNTIMLWDVTTWINNVSEK